MIGAFYRRDGGGLASPQHDWFGERDSGRVRARGTKGASISTGHVCVGVCDIFDDEWV